MRKNINTVDSLLFLAATLLLILALSTSCENEPLVDSSNQITTGINVKSLKISSSEGLETPYTIDLLAGQHHVAGTVTIDSDGSNLLVTYETNDNWALYATHLYVGDCEKLPVTRKGNPKIGKFPFKETHEGESQYTYSIPLSEIGECFCLAAHAEVNCGEGSEDSSESIVYTEGKSTNNDDGDCGEETAWAEGTDFPGNSWAMYMEFCLEDEEQEEEEN